MKFATRIVLTAGFSTLLLTSLYWMTGWHLIESIEHANREAIRTYLDSQPDLAHIDTSPLLREPTTSETTEIMVVIGGIVLFSLGTMGLTLLLLWQQARPVRELMQAIQAVDPAAPRLEPLSRQDELGDMSRHFSQLLLRIEGFIQREQNFTRFASHEMRSPLMVIRSSLALLQEMSQATASAPERRALKRVSQALEQMEQLTDSFLWLSREQTSDACRVDAQQLQHLLSQRISADANVQIRVEATLNWPIHPFVLSVILDNLIGNARQHGSGEIQLLASAHTFTVTNPIAHTGADTDSSRTSGFGYGLPIINQLCEKAGAHFHYERRDNHFIARVQFQPSVLAAD